MKRVWVLLMALFLMFLPAAFSHGESSGKKRVVIGQGELLSSFDYAADWEIAATWIQSNIGDCLVWWDRTTSKDIPWLAERWQRLNAKTWRFFLRRGVKFTNGEPFNAQAVKFTYDRILKDPKLIVHGEWLSFYAGSKVVDDYTLDITTPRPDPAFISKLVDSGCQVVPPKYFQTVGAQAFGRRPIGTGAFKFVEEVKDNRVVLAANENYWRGRPKIDELVFRAIPEASTRVNELLTGGVDLIVNVPAQDFDRIRNNPKTKLEIVNGNTTQMLVVRVTDKSGGKYLTSDPRIRAAIEYAIDKNALVKLTGGLGVPTRTRVTPPTFAWDETLYGPKNGDIYNPEKAKQLLKAAGYKGQPLEFVAPSGRWLMDKEVAEAIVGMLEAVGFKVDVKIVDPSTFNEKYFYPVYEGKPATKGLMMDSLGNSFFDPWIVGLEAHCKMGPRRSGYCNPAVDKLVEQAAASSNVEERAALYKRLQRILAEDRPQIFLYHQKEVYGMSRRLQWVAAPDSFLWMGNANVAP
jgi:peptide/nickel transport system substrate-binding protein